MGYSSSGSKKMLIKKYGARFNKGLKIINLRDILLLSFYLALVGIISFELLNYTFGNKWSNFRSLFSIYSRIARMDVYFRGGLRAYLEQFTLANTVIYAEVWKNYLSLVVYNDRLNTSKWVDANVQAVMGNDDILDLPLREIQDFKLSLSSSVNNFKLNEYLKDLNPSLRDTVLKSRVKIINYNGTTVQNELSTSDVSGVTFMGSFKVALSKLEKNLKVTRPELTGKKPPYNFNYSKVFFELGYDSAEGRYGTLRNAWIGIMDNSQDLLEKIKNLALIDEFNRSQSNIYTIVYISCSLYLLFFLGAVFLSFKLKTQLHGLLSQYINLRPEEVETMRVMIRNKISFYTIYKLDEATMMRNYFKHTYSAQTVDNGMLPEPAKSYQPKIKQMRKSQKAISNTKFSSIMAFWGFTLASISFLVYYVIVLDKTNASFTKIHNMMTLYTNMYENLTEAYHFYIYHSLYLVLGNYIKINGALPSEVIKSNAKSPAIDNLIKFIANNRPKINTLFSLDSNSDDGQNKFIGDNQALDRLFFLNTCEEIDPSIYQFEIYKAVCSRNRFATKGFMQYLYTVSETLQRYRDEFDANPSFINRTLNTWVLFPFQKFMYQVDVYGFIITTKVSFDTVYNITMNRGERSVEGGISEVKAYLNVYVEIFGLGFAVLYSVCFLIGIIGYLKKDLDVCGESFFNLHPEVISQNKMIQRNFGEAYSIKD